MTRTSYNVLGTAAPEAAVALGAAGARTRAEFAGAVVHLAARLPASANAGEAPASEVLIACDDRYHFAVALCASWLRGHAVALPPGHRPAMLDEVRRNDAVVCVLHDGEAPVGLDLRDVLAGASPASAPPELTLGDGRHVATLYTSGTTGASQRVAKRAAQLSGEVEVLYSHFGRALGSVLCSVPPRHIYGLLFGVLLPLRAAVPFVRETPLLTDALLELVRRHEVQSLVAVPPHLRGLESLERERLGTLARVFSSGAPLPDETFDALGQRIALEVTEVFGSTETGGIGYRRARGAPFRPFDDVVVSADDDGRMLLASPRLPPELAQPHACADRVELLADGRFRPLGRADDVVKVGGTRVALSAIEARVRALPGVTDAALLAQNAVGARGQEIWLAVAGAGWDARSLRSELGRYFDAVVLPRRYRMLPALPREATGKLRREALLELFATSADDEPSCDFERGPRRRESATRVLRSVRVSSDLVFFRGHFERWPVLPGVAQLGLLAVREALEVWPELGALRRVRQLKFRSPIEPDQQLELELLRREPSRVDFALRRQDEVCSSGALLFGPALGAAVAGDVR